MERGSNMVEGRGNPLAMIAGEVPETIEDNANYGIGIAPETPEGVSDSVKYTYPNDPYRPQFRDSVLEGLYDVEFVRDEAFIACEDEIYQDGDLIKNSEYLEKISGMSIPQRMVLLTQSARKVYTSPDDFKEYFMRYPEDAEAVMALCLQNAEVGSMPEFTCYQLSCKVFEAAAKTVEGYWPKFQAAVHETPYPTRANQWPNYLAVSKRSKLARDHLLGDYKTSSVKRFEEYGQDLSVRTTNFLDFAEKTHNGFELATDVGYQQNVLNRDEYKQLSDGQKADYLRDMIVECHNSEVFHEVYNSVFDESFATSMATDLSKNMGGAHKHQARSIIRGVHSILYETAHQEQTFQASRYLDLEPNFYEGEFPHDENAYKRITEGSIAEMKDAGSDDDVIFLLDFWDKNKDPFYGPTIASTISTINPQLGAGEILKRIEGASNLDRRRLVSLLFRLELQTITDIDEEGLTYLGRRFALMDHDKKIDFAHRLTPDGKVGVFDPDHHLQGFVQLGAADFDPEQEDKIKKEVLDITLDMLFSPAPDETEEEKAERERLLEDFKANYFDTYLKTFSQESDLRFNNLELPEQGWVLQYTKDADPASREVFFSFMAKYGEKGFKAFRTMEFGGTQMVADLMRYADKIDKLDLVLEDLSQIYDELPDAIHSLMGRLDVEFSEYEINKIIENISKTAANIVMAAIEVAKHDGDKTVIYQGIGGEPAEMVSFGRSIYGSDISLTALSSLHRLIDNLHSDQDAIFFHAFGELLFHESLSFNDVNSINLSEYLDDPEWQQKLTAAGFSLNRAGDPLYAYQIKEYLYRQSCEPEYLAADEISRRLKTLYEKPLEEFNLREYEGKTTNTPKTLEALRKSLYGYIRRVRGEFGQSDFEIDTVLDECGGGGRSGIPFRYISTIGGDGSRCINVNAFDISSQMIERAYQRVEEDRTSRELYDLTRGAGFQVSGDQGRHGDYTQVEGNFIDFDLEDYQKAFPESTKPQVINIGWHSFTFAGSVDNQMKVLQNAYEMLGDYGVLYLEIPDRSFGSYRVELQKYHREHPGVPFGTLVDAPSQKEGVASEQDSSIATPRYFPSAQEIERLADQAKFSMSAYPETYFVYHSNESGKQIPVIKEMLVELVKIPRDDDKTLHLKSEEYEEYERERDSHGRTEGPQYIF